MKRAELKKAEKAGAQEAELSRLRDALQAAEQACMRPKTHRTSPLRNCAYQQAWYR